MTKEEAETAKLEAETAKIKAETKLYPVVVAAGFAAAVATLAKLLFN